MFSICLCISQGYGLTLSAAPPLRRGSTPLPIKHQLRREEAVSEEYDWTPGLNESATPQISISNIQDSPTLIPPQQKYHGPLRIVLLGQNGVGKSSLALCLAGLSDRSLSIDSETQAAGKDYILFSLLVLSIKHQDAKDCTIFRFALDETHLSPHRHPRPLVYGSQNLIGKSKMGCREGIHLFFRSFIILCLNEVGENQQSTASAQTLSAQAEHVIY